MGCLNHIYPSIPFYRQLKGSRDKLPPLAQKGWDESLSWGASQEAFPGCGAPGVAAQMAQGPARRQRCLEARPGVCKRQAEALHSCMLANIVAGLKLWHRYFEYSCLRGHYMEIKPVISYYTLTSSDGESFRAHTEGIWHSTASAASPRSLIVQSPSRTLGYKNC